MGVEFHYRADGYFSMLEILHIYELAQNSFSGFEGFSGASEQRAFFHPDGNLPTLHEFKGVRLHSIRTEGYLPLKDESLDVFRNILKKGEVTIGKIGRLLVRCGFEEKTSKQTKRYYDTVSIRIEKGKKCFGYYANGSKVTGDVKYRKQFMREVIEAINLPLKVLEENESFRFVDADSGEPMEPGLFGMNPYAFNCEIPDASIDDLVDRMKVFLTEFASKKRFTYTWSTGCSGLPPETETSKRIFEMVHEAKFPAERYFLTIEFYLDDIEGVEALKSLCGPKDHVFSELCGFDLPHNNYGRIEIHTTSKGHQLELTMPTPEYINEVENKLGLKFKKRSARG